MFRFLLAVALCGGLALGGASTAAASPAALDFEEPVVPPELLRHEAPPLPATASASTRGGARLLAQGMSSAAFRAADAQDEPAALAADSAGLFWLHENAPGRVSRVIPGSQWSDGGGGCALWSWNTC
ncbi:MAG TPA: hypothetical protein VFE37_14490 [Chloroflexota bacterium]|nr:hypothetical protein [Chloroflexota bacterium]